MSESPSPLVSACVGLGSNLDGPERRIHEAFAVIRRLPDIRVLRRSRLYRTAPWGVAAQPPFVNAVVEVETSLAPHALLDALLSVERSQGRRRDGVRWGPRTIDLDLLTYGDRRIDEPGLTVPHPYLAERAFVLVPLADIDPDRVIPGVGIVRDLLARVDAGACEVIDETDRPSA